VKIREGDELLEARLTNGSNEILMALKSGKAIHFNEEKVRSMGRNASGVRGIRLANEKDVVIGMICVEDPETTSVLVVSEKGYGKRSSVEDYRLTNRGGKGVKTINITDKTGKLIAIKSVNDNDDLMIINKSGIAIRLAVSDMRIMGRATQGVRVINLRDGDKIAAIAKVEIAEDEEGLLDEAVEEGEITEEATMEDNGKEIDDKQQKKQDEDENDNVEE